MWIDLTEKEQELFQPIIKLPPDFAAAEKVLSEKTFTAAEITRAALAFAKEAIFDAGEFAWQNGIPHTEAIMPNLHSTYIVEIIGFLLPHGLDPNAICDDENIMNILKYIDNEYLAADALMLLLEHGGRYDLWIPGEMNELSGSLYFDVWCDIGEQRNRQRFSALVHCLMVLIGYGARMKENAVKTFREFDSSVLFDPVKLKDHRNYSFCVAYVEDSPAISIFDKKTLCEVMRVQF